jgi:hypothetical protein
MSEPPEQYRSVFCSSNGKERGGSREENSGQEEGERGELLGDVSKLEETWLKSLLE